MCSCYDMIPSPRSPNASLNKDSRTEETRAHMEVQYREEAAELKPEALRC